VAGLKRNGWQISAEYTANHKKVLKIMKNMGIQCRKRKRFVSTTNSKHNMRTYPNLAKDLVVDRTNKLWCADITYIRILTAFVYLAAIIDTFSRKILHFNKIVPSIFIALHAHFHSKYSIFVLHQLESHNLLAKSLQMLR